MEMKNLEERKLEKKKKEKRTIQQYSHWSSYRTNESYENDNLLLKTVKILSIFPVEKTVRNERVIDQSLKKREVKWITY